MGKSQEPLPLTIISGYLGSGKTTLINHLLRNADGRRLVVLVNDFGELPIDFDLIESVEGDTINLSNGCACCSMGGDLYNALVDVLDMNPQPDHLIIEASGVADPVRIANIAEAEPDLRLDAIISLVDAETLERLIENAYIGETIAHQISSSDIILLNKLDLVDNKIRASINDKLNNIAPMSKRIETVFSKVPIELIVGGRADNNQRIIEPLATINHGSDYFKWSNVYSNRLNKKKLEEALENCSNLVLRLKGIVYFEDTDTPQIVQCVGNRCTITPIHSVHLDPQTSISTQSRFVAIGLVRDLKEANLNAIFEEISK